MAWPTTTGFSYYRFSTGAILNVVVPFGTCCFSTNGEIITFLAPPAAATPRDLMYYDTAVSAPSVFDTGLAAAFGGTSVTQSVIAFQDNTVPVKIAWYDILRQTKSLVAGEPVGVLPQTGGPAIWNDYIVFAVDEVSWGVDCNGNGVISASEYCLRDWNVKTGGSTIDNGVPPTSQGLAIYGNKVVFIDATSNLVKYAPLVIKGDIDQDGTVDITDLIATWMCQFVPFNNPSC